MIEISAEVSLVMIVPPVESACSVPGQRELLLQRPDLLPLPVQVFEMVSAESSFFSFFYEEFLLIYLFPWRLGSL